MNANIKYIIHACVILYTFTVLVIIRNQLCQKMILSHQQELS